MQTFFSNISDMFNDGYLIISNNSLYSAILAAVIGIILSGVLVGLIMSARCREKNSQLLLPLNDTKSGEGQGDEEIAGNLGQAQKLIQQLKVELDDKDRLVGQMEKDLQNVHVQNEYTAELEEHIHQRNEQIFQIVDTLEADMGLDKSEERPYVDDVWAEALWQRHNQLMTHLQNRLHANTIPQVTPSEGQSFEELAKKDQIIAELTQTLENQSSHITKLEHDIEAQRHVLQESLLKAQAHANEIEEKQEKTLARIAQLEKELQEAKKSAIEKVVVIIQQIPQQVMGGLDELAFKPFIEQVERIKHTAAIQSQHAIEAINHYVIEPAISTYHAFTENLSELPELSMTKLQRQGEEMKKVFSRLKEQVSDSAGEAVAGVKSRIPSSTLQPTAEA